jgi:predicted outer membrane repeat protein
MKRIILSELKAVCISICFLLMCVPSPAKDIYVSPEGVDTNDGELQSTPVQTISRALSIAADGDIIHVLGFIELKKEPVNEIDKHGYSINPDGTSTFTVGEVTYNTWNPSGTCGVKMLDKNLIIRGVKRSACGFDGGDTTRLFKFENISKKVKFESLTFRNGCSDPNDDHGAAFWIRSAAPDFHDCAFTNNKNVLKADGGAFYFEMKDIGDKSVFSECSFQNNTSKENGGDFFITSGSYEFFRCYMLGTDMTKDIYGGSRGGAFFIRSNGNETVNLSVKRTVFQNYLTKGDGGVVMYEDGGDPKVNTLTFEACSFLNNVSKNKGGAIFLDARTTGVEVKASFINTTFYRNQSDSEGGAFDLRNGAAGELKIVNCTFTENKTKFDDNGGGICFHGDNKKMLKKIYNSIFEYNTADNTSRTDLAIKDGVPEADDLFIDRSFIGAVRGGGNFVDSYVSNNEINYDLTGSYHSKINFAFPADFFIEYFRCIPLSYFDNESQSYSPGIGYGKAQYLQELGADRDQLGWKRLFTGGFCCVGSVEVDDEELMSLVDTEAGYWPTSIEKLLAPTGNVNVYYAHNVLTIEGLSNTDEEINIQVFGISGNRVKTVRLAVHAGSYKEFVELPPLPHGIYIAKVQAGRNNHVVKFIN